MPRITLPVAHLSTDNRYGQPYITRCYDPQFRPTTDPEPMQCPTRLLTGQSTRPIANLNADGQSATSGPLSGGRACRLVARAGTPSPMCFFTIHRVPRQGCKVALSSREEKGTTPTWVTYAAKAEGPQPVLNRRPENQINLPPDGVRPRIPFPVRPRQAK